MSVHACPGCQAPLDGALKFCPRCGAAQSEPDRLRHAADTAREVVSAVQQVDALITRATTATPPPRWSVVVGEALPPAMDLLARVAASPPPAQRNDPPPPERGPAGPAPPIPGLAQRCSHCSVPLALDAHFCPRCGRATAASCSKCSTPCKPGALFCYHCGAKLS